MMSFILLSVFFRIQVCTETDIIELFLFNLENPYSLENIYYFPSCSGGPISLLQSFTHSLPVRRLETGRAGGGGGGGAGLPYKKARNVRRKI